MNLIKKTKTSLLSIFLVSLGITIMLCPKLSEIYSTHKQEKLLSLWQDSLLSVEATTAENDTTENCDAENHESSSTTSIESDRVAYSEQRILEVTTQKEKEERARKEEEAKAKQRNEYIQSHMEGVLSIDKISLFSPILKGASKENLNLSISSIENTGKPWTKGNFCIAGHRSHTFGRHFNRLDELEIGDSIEVIDLADTHYTYTITQKLYVQFDDVWVLRSDENKKEITLITCHPIYKRNSPTRLIIKGEIVE